MNLRIDKISINIGRKSIHGLCIVFKLFLYMVLNRVVHLMFIV